MNEVKRRALRIAVYLHRAGVVPVLVGQSYREQLAALVTQYETLSPEARKEARRLGCQAIRDAPGLEIAARDLVSSIAPSSAATQQPSINRKKIAAVIEQMPEARRKLFQQIRRGWSQRTPPCPYCRMWGGFPKRSWPSREVAEEVWQRQPDRATLRVYICPGQTGFWHLGHLPEQDNSAPAVSSLSSSLLPDCK